MMRNNMPALMSDYGAKKGGPIAPKTPLAALPAAPIRSMRVVGPAIPMAAPRSTKPSDRPFAQSAIKGKQNLGLNKTPKIAKIPAVKAKTSGGGVTPHTRRPGK